MFKLGRIIQFGSCKQLKIGGKVFMLWCVEKDRTKQMRNLRKDCWPALATALDEPSAVAKEASIINNSPSSTNQK